MVHKQYDRLVEPGGIGSTTEAGTICNHMQWWTDRLQSIRDWTRSTDLYGPVYYEASVLIIGHNGLK
jgi:hypothetical protein